VNAELLAVLNETLDELTEQQQLFQALIEEYKGNLSQAQEERHSAQSQQIRLEQQRREVVRKSELLRNYLARLDRQPGALLRKVKRLSEEQRRIEHDLHQAETQLSNAESALRGKRERLAEAEKRSEEIRREWVEVSQHIERVGLTAKLAFF
jgi:chromosome segregation ATPase